MTNPFDGLTGGQGLGVDLETALGARKIELGRFENELFRDGDGFRTAFCGAGSFDLGRGSTGNRCPPNRSKRGRHTLVWVGPIPGVDALRLFLMKPLPIGAMHTRHYEAARDLLRAGLKKE